MLLLFVWRTSSLRCRTSSDSISTHSAIALVIAVARIEASVVEDKTNHSVCFSKARCS